MVRNIRDTVWEMGGRSGAVVKKELLGSSEYTDFEAISAA